MNANSKCCDPKVMAVALARWCIGIILLFAGISKFSMGIGKFAEMIPTMFEKTWLPKALLVPYGYSLPFVELILGAMLILGLFRNASLSVTTLLFISLMFGQFLLAIGGDEKAGSGMFQNTVFTFLAAGLLFLHEHDRWTLYPCGCCEKESCCAPPAS